MASALMLTGSTATAPCVLRSSRSTATIGCGIIPVYNRSKAESAAILTSSSRRIESNRFSARAAVAVDAGQSELDLVSAFSEIVPDTIVGDDYDRFKPTAATVTSSLILGFSSLPEAKFDAAIESALAYGKCFLEQENKFSCFLDKALVNVGAQLSTDVSGKVSTEVDPRLAHDTPAIISKVRDLLRLYAEVEVSPDRLLFKIPATWEGIEAARQLEDDGIQTHLTGVNSFAQAAACAFANVSVIQVSVGRVRDWARTSSGDADVDAAKNKGDDPGVSMVRRAFDFISKHGHKTKVMASNLRSKSDVLSLLGVDYLVVPLKVLEELQKTTASSDLTRSIAPLPAGADAVFSRDEMRPWDAARFKAELGPCAAQLLEAEVASAVAQAQRVEAHFEKIWPPPNV